MKVTAILEASNIQKRVTMVVTIVAMDHARKEKETVTKTLIVPRDIIVVRTIVPKSLVKIGTQKMTVAQRNDITWFLDFQHNYYEKYITNWRYNHLPLPFLARRVECRRFWPSFPCVF